MAGFDKTTLYRSAFFAVAMQWSVRAIGLISVMALARLLHPSDFGIMAVALTAAAFIELFGWIGLRQALVRIKTPDRAHYDTAFTIQLGLFLALMLVLIAIAPLAARFYGLPALTPILWAMSLRLFFLALVNIGIVDFERDMQFGRDMKMRLSVRLLSLVASLAAAFTLRNYWALVVGLVAQSAFYTAASYAAHPYRPRLDLSRRAELLGVSLWMFLSSTSELVQQQVERLILGRFAATATVGLYSVSKDLSSIFTQEIATALNRVTFVAVAQGEEDRSAQIGTMVGAYAAIVAPLAAGLVATALDAIPVLLGAKWLAAAPLLEIIAVYTGVQAVYLMIASVLQASGFARRAAILNLSGAIFSVAAISAAALHFGDARAIAFAALAVNATMLATGLFLLCRQSGARFVPLLANLFRPAAAAAFMVLAIWELVPDTGSPFLDLVLSVLLGAPVYAAALLLIWAVSGRPPSAEREAVTLLAGLRRRFSVQRSA
ncbi:MAG TPA: oligosaccharide flippase family protein [Allosphingosinicella sp.]|jgi:O-antigen/teichoic acid export membrane protein